MVGQNFAEVKSPDTICKYLGVVKIGNRLCYQFYLDGISLMTRDDFAVNIKTPRYGFE
jgi:hypothetical protein